MIQNFIYGGHSGLIDRGDSRAIRLAPNLAREAVAFDAELLSPLRFREAISALHDVVISDLRFVKRDKTEYQEWKKQQGARDAVIRREALQKATSEIAARRNEPIPANLEKEFSSARKRYWTLRLKYSDYLRKHDPELWRKLVPCDPVITVAEDVVFFECFSKDESGYGCLSVDRSRAFGQTSNLQLGTTNVDYSENLYEQFQTLRTYRPTRFNLDPEGFSVATQSVSAHREEKIDLPTSWLRGFMKLQAAMTMPTTRIMLTRDSVYSLLAFLKRNIAKKSPRALRFEMKPGRPPRMVLEPWEKQFDVGGPIYDGPSTAPIRIWGTRRLLNLARLLPIVESIEVHLLASGLPSFWIARMGEMSFTLGLSGWTSNDWSSGSALDLLQPPRAPSLDLIASVARSMKTRRAATLAQVKSDVEQPDDFLVAAALRQLAQTGQLIYDIAGGIFRFRQIMSQPLGEAQLGPEDGELAAARDLLARNKIELIDRQDGPNLTRVIIGKVESKPVEILVDPDDRIKLGKCMCGHFKQFGLRNGPCRHMIALRFGVSVHGRRAYEESGFLNRLLGRPSVRSSGPPPGRP
jgi:hypothetical protein